MDQKPMPSFRNMTDLSSYLSTLEQRLGSSSVTSFWPSLFLGIT
jgi:hypothetical protein